MTRRTKIVATLGPATRDAESVRAILSAGVDVVRLNFAHDTPRVHAEAANLARAEAEALGRVVGVLVDLPGPKMRTGPIRDEQVVLEAGREFVLTAADVDGDHRHVSTSVEDLPSMVASGDEIYLADGQIVLHVDRIEGPDVITKVFRRGVLRSRKGMHLPAAEGRVQAFTPEDRTALEDALALEADLIGLSFVRDAEDLGRARAALPRQGRSPRLVAKIETASALENLDEIVAAADAVMVARGDLGIQTSLERMPLIQKEIIRKCNRSGIPVITATQMLESMTHSPLPSRAEVSDVANAVLDGTDALMLSEETAVGDHPASAVATMATTAVAAEAGSKVESHAVPAGRDDPVAWAVAHAAVEASEDLGVAAILCPTQGGATPRRVAAFRPSMRIVGMSARPETLGGLALVWGVVPLSLPQSEDPRDTAEDVARATRSALEAGLVSEGDLVTVVAGSPGRRAGRTDYMRIARA